MTIDFVFDKSGSLPACGKQACAGGGEEKEMANAKLIFIGEVTQVAGVAAFVAGVVLSLHHWPAAAALIGGGAAFYVGKKLRAQ